MRLEHSSSSPGAGTGCRAYESESLLSTAVLSEKRGGKAGLETRSRVSCLTLQVV